MTTPPPPPVRGAVTTGPPVPRVLPSVKFEPRKADLPNKLQVGAGVGRTNGHEDDLVGRTAEAKTAHRDHDYRKDENPEWRAATGRMPVYVLAPNELDTHHELVVCSLDTQLDQASGETFLHCTYRLPWESVTVRRGGGCWGGRDEMREDSDSVTRFVLTTDNEGLPVKGTFYAADGSAVVQPAGRMGWSGDRPIVYVSRGRHNAYPTGGTWWRALGRANDHAAPSIAAVWAPNRMIGMAQAASWVGDLAEAENLAAMNKTMPHAVSTSTLRRLILR